MGAWVGLGILPASGLSAYGAVEGRRERERGCGGEGGRVYEAYEVKFLLHK